MDRLKECCELGRSRVGLFWDEGFKRWRIIANHPDLGMINTEGREKAGDALNEANKILERRVTHAHS